MTYLPQLDGLRGLAILAVLLFHCTVTNRYIQGGWAGVDLFFVLSGYLITRILTEEYEVTGKINIKRFYWRRVLRLYPALLACVVLAGIFVYLGWCDGTIRDYLRIAGAVLFYAANVVDFSTKPIDQTWSLAAEEQFYFVWPILLLGFLLKLKPKTRLWVVGALIGLAGGSRVVLHGYHVGWWRLYTWPFTRADSLMAGALIAFVGRSKSSFSALASKLKYLVVPSCVFLAYVLLSQDDMKAWVTTLGLTLVGLAWAILLVVAISQSTKTGSRWMEKLNVMMIPAGGAAVFAAVWVEKMPLGEAVLICVVVAGGLGAALILNEGAEEGLLRRMFDTKILKWIGRRSYGIYLYHVPIFMALNQAPVSAKIAGSLGQPVFALTEFAAVFIVAWLSYKFLEAPILALKDRKA